MSLPSSLSCWAVVAPGLEALAAAELATLGLVPGESEPGGIAFAADADQLARALLQLRTVNRITVRLAEFPARTFGELERHAAKLDWTAVIAPGMPVHFRVVSKKSRLYHQGAIAERLAGVLRAAVPTATIVPSPTAVEALEDDPAALPGVQQIMVRLWRDTVTVSADATGPLLHRRGWRQFTGKAPLRETLAAAMLLGAGWRGDGALLDPFCGSGTLVIEAALCARGIAPGRGRRFALEQWPAFDPRAMTEARRLATAGERPSAGVPLIGYDRDAGAVEGARANAERAGVAADVRVERATVAMLGADADRGLVITNPPYGVRVGESGPLRDLYATLGQRMREGRPGWELAILSADPRLTGHLRLPLVERWRTTNGGLPVRLLAREPESRE